MSEHYHDVGDLRFLKEMGKLAPQNSTPGSAWIRLFPAKVELFRESIANSSH